MIPRLKLEIVGASPHSSTMYTAKMIIDGHLYHLCISGYAFHLLNAEITRLQKCEHTLSEVTKDIVHLADELTKHKSTPPPQLQPHIGVGVTGRTTWPEDERWDKSGVQ